MVSDGQTAHCTITDLLMIKICEVIWISHNKHVCAEHQSIPLHVHAVCMCVTVHAPGQTSWNLKTRRNVQKS